MKAMILKGFGGIENFSVENIPEPEINENDILIRIKAISIAPIDIKTRQGSGMADTVKKENPMLIGWDIAGEVAKTGKQIKNFKIGDAVFGTINFPGAGCSYAEFAAAPAGQVTLKPGNISFEEAATATQSPLIAWQALINTGKIKQGQRVLIHGGAGGVGNFAIQIAAHTGCHVITTAAGEDTAFVRKLGADEIIDYKTQQFEQLIDDVDFILDTIGGDNFIRSLKVLKPDGMIVLLPSDKKDEADKVAKEEKNKNYKHILLRSDGEGMHHIAGMLADGSMKVHIDKTYPFEEIPLAHEQLEKGKVKGKIVIKI